MVVFSESGFVFLVPPFSSSQKIQKRILHSRPIVVRYEGAFNPGEFYYLVSVE